MNAPLSSLTDLAVSRSRLFRMFQTISWVQVVPHLGNDEIQTSSGLTDSSLISLSQPRKPVGNTWRWKLKKYGLFLNYHSGVED